MRQFTLLCLMLVMAVASFAQTARLQVIHNSPTPTVDIYANGGILLDNFAFRTATPFIDVPADVPIELGVALANSTSADDALVNIPVQFEEGKTYVAVAAGVVGGNPGFELFVYDMGEETAPDDNLKILFFHGSPDAPEVDITLTDGTVLFDDVEFGEFQGYLEVPAATYDVAVTPSDDNSNQLAAYSKDLSFWKGRTLTIFASGFLGDGSFEPWVALSNGGTFPLNSIPVVDNDPTAKVQIIHNSPSAAAAEVDIYVNDDLLLDNFAFRTATPFVEVPVDVELNIGVAPANSTSADDAIAVFPVTFEAGKRYIAVANGLVGGNPAFTIDIFDMGREQANDADKLDLAFLHGSPDAPPVDIAARNIGNLVEDIEFGEFADYLSLNPTQYFIDIKPAGSNDIVATFDANVIGLDGRSAIAIASGLLGGNPDFTVIVVLADGTVVELPQATLARLQVIHNSPTPTVDIYVNEELFLDNFAYRTATPFVDVPAGVELNIGVALANSASADDILVNFPVTLDAGGSYVVVANGIVGNANTPFNLEVFGMGSETVASANDIGILFFHGSPDAPEVDITLTDQTVLFDDVEFGEFQGYLVVPGESYAINVTPGNDNNTVVASYIADLSFWKGKTAVIFASGFLGDGSFEPWVALSNGGTFPLAPNFDDNTDPSAFIGNNSTATATISEWQVMPNPASDWLTINTTLEQPTTVQISIVNASGQMVQSQYFGTQDSGTQTFNLQLRDLTDGIYYLRMETDQEVKTEALSILRR